ncbi:MAG TPA: NADH-quinone oxidoreductase subunit K [Clostridiales bacterium]|nr:NADH-quinone oxidoreductase subunit K [Clostridiales bacterium]HOL92073.1 NADH-quinone oxidoreductase subunit K [Clostridiales bacterium]HPP34867.1 NADH-quinone oxidoreductase subunit K [Clostridiales bacterium]
MNAIGNIVFIVGFLLIIAGCYCLIRTYHMLKIILGIEVAMKAVTLFITYAGYINGNIDLAQSFVITSIVIEVVVAVVAAGIAINLYRKYGSMDIRNLRKLKG